VLSPLQQRIATIVAGLPEAEDFALAGGAALIVRGDVDRGTRDLDFFGLTRLAVDRLVPAAEQALRDADLQVERVIESHGFARLAVTDTADRTELDLATDARLFPVEQGPGYPMLAGEELAVDKLLAVFGRAEARDFVDLMAVEHGYGLDHLLELAAEKDRGFDAAIFAEMTGNFARLRRDEFAVDDGRYEQLRRLVGVWRQRALESARERPGQERSGRDLGIDR
jgi:hypothetical protein